MSGNLMESIENVYRWKPQKSLVLRGQRWSVNHCLWLVGDVCPSHPSQYNVLYWTPVSIFKGKQGWEGSCASDNPFLSSPVPSALCCQPPDRLSMTQRRKQALYPPTFPPSFHRSTSHPTLLVLVPLFQRQLTDHSESWS